MPEIITRKEALALGLKFYFTGKPCPQGHIVERYVSGYACPPCLLLNEEKIRAHPEKGKAYLKRKAANNKKRNSRKKKEDPAFYEAYKKYMREYHKARRAADPEFAKSKYDRARAWFKANPEAARAYASSRRKKMIASGPGFTRDDVKTMLARQKNICAGHGCFASLSDGYHVDHIMPIALGGDHEVKNLQCLCPPCNVRKSAKHPIDWAQENGVLL